MDLTEGDYTLSLLMKRNSEKTSEELEQTAQIKMADNTWTQEKQLYEIQLNQLQEQLVAAMVQNQQLGDENERLKKNVDTNVIAELKSELEVERSKRLKNNNIINQLLIQQQSSRIQTSDAGSSSLNGCDKVGEEPVVGSPTQDLEEVCTYAHKGLTVRLLDLKISVWNFLHDRFTDFVNDDDVVIQEVTDEELSVRKLKENVARFSDAIQPLKKSYNFMFNLFAWTNPWFTVAVILVYFYSLWLEMFIPLILLLLIVQLSINYLHARGISNMFIQSKRKVSEEEPKEDQVTTSLSERYQLVLQIARKVQNTLGGLADTLEKVQNLLHWQHLEATKMLYQSLLGSFVVSCILPTNTVLLIAGLACGVKLFFITPIYVRFPKVQKRYDDFDRLWQDLPTHSQNMKRRIEEVQETSAQTEANSSPKSSSSSPDTPDTTPSKSADQQWERIVFCDRFALPNNEAPLHDWIEGRRCTLMNRESVFSNMKHGRLYLTQHYLCFERNQFHAKKNIAISLLDITGIKKAKPISFMPGPGMAIEVEVMDTPKPYLFAAMMGRDEAFDSIIRAGRLLNLSWSNK